MPIDNDPIFANAILNAIFNVSTAILAGFVLMPFTRLVRRMVPDAKEQVSELRIDNFPVDSRTTIDTDILLNAAEEDTKQLLRK